MFSSRKTTQARNERTIYDLAKMDPYKPRWRINEFWKIEIAVYLQWEYTNTSLDISTSLWIGKILGLIPSVF